MRDFLIDTDTASDDAVAIIMALAAPDVRVLALTTVAGNVALAQATRNALVTVDVCGSDVPVFEGAGAPLIRALRDAHWFHGADGLGDHGYPAPKRKAEDEHAVDAILRLSHAHAGLTLVTLGPLTNIALALARDPSLATRIGRCVVMGGAPCCEGNVTPAAEYNIWVDPEAARAVFRSRLPIEMVGWHVSRGASVLSDAEIAEIEKLGTARARFAMRMQQPRPRSLWRPDRRSRPVARRPDGDGGGAGPLGRPEMVAQSGRDRDAERTHPRHDRRRPARRQFRRDQRRRLGRGRGRERRLRRAVDLRTRRNSRRC